ncbi:MAG: Saccharopine dehydrogenase [Conexibacter sp.]|nr:Saccharopine dehydrogenase [Conexibacter sp.]
MAGTIAVYGATGYTGRLVARELARRGLPCVLAGRDREKLARLAEAVRADLGARGGGDGAGAVATPAIATRAVALDDAAGLRDLMAASSAVIDCAGPFVRYGEPVVRAAVESGTHYVDTTGEQSYMQLVRDRFDAAARQAGVAVVPAMGFDYAPGDLLAQLTAQGAEPLRELVIAYAIRGVQPTRGTARTALGMAAEGAIVYEDGGWRRAPLRAQRGRFPFPDPVGPRPVMRYPSGEALTVPHHVRTRKVTTLITVETLAGSDLAAPFVGALAPAVALALRSPLRALVEPALARLPEGPSEERRQSARFTLVAVAHGEDGRSRSGVARGRDVYGLTAAAAVHGAALMADAGYDRAGVLSPATAYEPRAFLDALAPFLSYELEPAAG